MAKKPNQSPAEELVNLTEEEAVPDQAADEQAAPSLEEQHAALLQEHQALLDAHNELKEKFSQLMDAPATPAAKETPGVPADTFEVDGQTYRMALPKMKIKGVGERTALEVLLDDEPYEKLGGKTIKEYLVSYGSIAVQKA